MVAERAFSHFDQPAVNDTWRHTRRNPCPVCGGGDDDKRGRGVRCYGKTSSSPDGRQWTICTREDYAGELVRSDRSGGYTHLSDGGACKCGEDHRGAAAQRPTPRPEPTPAKVTRAHLSKKPDEVSEYRTLESGEPLRKLRYGYGEGKRFVWQRPDGAGDWRDCSGDRPMPDAYRAELLADADPFEPLAIVEGEKDADKLRALGWRLVVSPPDGAMSWSDEYSRLADGRNVVIFADKDAPTERYPQGKGQEHAAKVGRSIAPQAFTARIVLFDQAHDVGDWIDAGGTLDELRAIAAHAPIIAARQPSALNESFTSQDGLSKTDPKGCPNCQTWQDRARIAETTVRNLRAEQAIEDKYLAIPNETLSAPAKVAAIALRRELAVKKCDDRVERDAERRPRIFRAAIAQRMGVGESAVGASLQKVAAVQLFERRERRTREDTATFYAPGPYFDQPEAVATPERANTWGGKRVKTCPSCGSEDLETRTVCVCRGCGTHFDQRSHDTNKPTDDVSEEAQSLNESFTSQDGLSNETPTDTQEEGQDNTPPITLLVSTLAPVDVASWIGGYMPGCEHEESQRHTLKKTGAIVCACGARYVPALDGAEVRALTDRSIG